MSVVRQRNFPVIFDTATSLAVSGNCSDFEREIKKPINPIKLGGMAKGLYIEEIGIVKKDLYCSRWK